LAGGGVNRIPSFKTLAIFFKVGDLIVFMANWAYDYINSKLKVTALIYKYNPRFVSKNNPLFLLLISEIGGLTGLIKMVFLLFSTKTFLSNKFKNMSRNIDSL
jgi:hypothetical protein